MEITSNILIANFGYATMIGWYDIYMVRISEYDENNFATKFIAIRDAYRYPKKERFAIVQDDDENIICEVKSVHELQRELKSLGIDIEITIPKETPKCSPKLSRLVKEVNNLNDKMHAAIVDVLKAHEGLIRTDNVERTIKGLPMRDNIYTISMDGDEEQSTEKRVLAVGLFDDKYVGVLPVYSSDETINALTDQEVKGLDGWEFIQGGYTTQNATLASICEALEQYV